MDLLESKGVDDQKEELIMSSIWAWLQWHCDFTERIALRVKLSGQIKSNVFMTWSTEDNLVTAKNAAILFIYFKFLYIFGESDI